jgi:hypothetical protein
MRVLCGGTRAVWAFTRDASVTVRHSRRRSRRRAPPLSLWETRLEGSAMFGVT